mmetsp:Transcript_25445/g.80103  ORF Transcript_25445/g.80103 Transcript_25445/m.80103 type:complete len:220 (+) Transcript_25445:324-983(+)
MHHTPFALHDERAACVRFDFSPHLPRLFCAAHGQQRKLQNTLGRSFGTAAIRLCSRVSDSGRRSSSSKTRRPLRFPIGLARTAASPCTSAMAASRSASVYESRSRRVVGSRRGGGRTSRRSGGRGSGRFLLDLEGGTRAYLETLDRELNYFHLLPVEAAPMDRDEFRVGVDRRQHVHRAVVEERDAHHVGLRLGHTHLQPLEGGLRLYRLERFGAHPLL